MKKIITLSAIFIATLGASFGQQIQEISTTTGYKKQSYVRLTAGDETLVENTKWDIAFSVFGQQDAGIHANEASGSSMGQPLPFVQIFDGLTDDFSTTLDPIVLAEFELRNPEKSWAFGAFNEGRDLANPLDYGWGEYKPATNQVVGSKVFLIKLRDGSFRKLKIESLSAAGYSFKYANLDGTGETSKIISKADFSGKTLAYFSFSTQNTVPVEPTGAPFDLLYTRYSTPLLDPSSGTFLSYNVTGILSGRGVQVAKADGISPAAAQFSEWKDSLRSDLNAIGYDWKTLAGTAWDVDADRVYFVKTADQRVWKLQFIDFEGSSSGKTVFEKTDLGIISAVDKPDAVLTTFDIFPNPTLDGQTNLVFSAKKSAQTRIILTDVLGKNVWSSTARADVGLNATTLDFGKLANGIYQLTMTVAGQNFVKTVLIQR